MFANFDWDVIIRSLPYLFLDGMLHHHADFDGDRRRHRDRHAAGARAAVGHSAFPMSRAPT